MPWRTARNEQINPETQHNLRKRKLSMITNKEDEQKDQRVGLDMEAFEMQVDQEIDNLFVPGNGVEGADENASDVQMVDDVEIQVVGDSSPEVSAAPVFAEEKVDTASKGMDVSAFEVQIDKEIDNLFVPADFGDVPMDQSSFGAAGQGPEVLGALEVEAAAAQAAGDHVDPPPLRLELEVPEGEPTVYASQQKAPVPDRESSSLPESLEEPVKTSQELELPNLVENFNIAYLSLDWEFSSENLSKLWAALEGLQAYCGKSRETLFLFKLLRSLLHRLRNKPDSVQPEIIEMMRDGHEMLKTLLVSSDGPGTREKEKLKSLAGRYRVLRDGSSESSEEAQIETPQVERVSPFLAFSNAPVTDWTSMTRDAFPQWMESHALKAAELDKVLENQAADILSFDEKQNRKRTLSDVTSRLTRIRSVLEEYALIRRGREQEWKNGVEWLLEFNGHGDATEVRSDDEVIPESVSQPVAAPVREVPPEAMGSSGEQREEQVFFFTLGGRKFGILSKHVVKIDSVNKKRVEKIIARGHATLGDFKPFYRSLKAGLLGAWSGLPVEILKTYRFVPISLEMPEMEEASSAVGGVVLVSSGRNHGVIFVDSGAVDLHNATPLTFKKDSHGMVLGLAQAEIDSSIDVLNMDALLRRPRQEIDPEVTQ